MAIRIQNDEELAEFTDELFKLTSKAEAAPEEDAAIELLTLLIEHYEAERYPLPKADFFLVDAKVTPSANKDS